jgi:hypothetical protein
VTYGGDGRRERRSGKFGKIREIGIEREMT